MKLRMFFGAPIPNYLTAGCAALALFLAACGSKEAPPKPAAVETPAKAAPAAEEAAPRTTAQVWLGDLPGMTERRAVRMLVVFNKTNYFLDGPQQRGATYDMGVEFEKWLNRSNKDKTRPIRVLFIPTSRDHLLDRSAGRPWRHRRRGPRNHARTPAARELRQALHR